MKIVEKQEVMQKWVLVTDQTIQGLYARLNQSSQSLSKQGNFSPKHSSICYNSDTKQYTVLVSYEAVIGSKTELAD